jgi:hypothetical protein
MSDAAATAARYARRVKIVFLAMIFVLLFLDTYYPALVRSPMLRLLPALMGGLLALTWVHLDGAARGLQPGPGLRAGVVLLAAVFVPLWLFRTRAAEQAWWALGRFALIVAVLAIAFSFGVAVLEQRGIVPAAAPALAR